jgi:hypothetical protein
MSDYYASAFFLGVAVFFAFTGAAAAAFADFLLAERFSLVLMIARFLATPKEPLNILPFFDFLSPLPMVCSLL